MDKINFLFVPDCGSLIVRKFSGNKEQERKQCRNMCRLLWNTIRNWNSWGNLTRRELKELEEKEKTPVQKVEEALIMALPAVCGAAALSEYLLIPDLARNKNPMYYVYVLAAMMAAYLCAGLFAAFKRRRGNKVYYEKLRYGAPRISALFLLLALYDYLTLKTGTLTQPFVPCMNFIINAFVSDYPHVNRVYHAHAAASDDRLCDRRQPGTGNGNYLRLFQAGALLG